MIFLGMYEFSGYVWYVFSMSSVSIIVLSESKVLCQIWHVNAYDIHEREIFPDDLLELFWFFQLANKKIVIIIYMKVEILNYKAHYCHNK